MNKKELIRQSAIRVIARNGFHDAKVKAIADEAGIAAGTVYLYFKSKEDILDYIFCIEHQKRADFINDLYKKNIPIDKVLDSFLDFHFDCFRNEPDTANVLFQEVTTVSSFTDAKSKLLIEDVFKAFLNILKKEQENGRIRKDIDTVFLSSSIINLLRLSSYNLLSKGEAAKYDDMRKCLKALILNGINS